MKVVAVDTLNKLFRNVPPFDNSVIWSDLSPQVVNMARMSYSEDLSTMRKKLERWISNTEFSPKPNTRHSIINVDPVTESINYGGSIFIRHIHGIGVRLATMIDFIVTFAVVWTTNNYAFVYELKNGFFVLSTILSDQTSAFSTWMEHFGGKRIWEQDRAYSDRTPEELFEDLVVPLYGADSMLRSPLMTRRTPYNHVIWQAVRETSYHILTNVDYNERMQWRDILRS
jgi:hypothetical protein